MMRAKARRPLKSETIKRGSNCQFPMRLATRTFGKKHSVVFGSLDGTVKDGPLYGIGGLSEDAPAHPLYRRPRSRFRPPWLSALSH